MFASSVRDRPWRALWFSSSEARLTCSTSPSWPTEMPCANRRVSSPFGPFTFTVLPSIAIETPFGTGIGSLPIRDIVWILLLPDEGEELATRAGLPRLRVGHDP